jgi:hypothetical protein
MNSNEIAEFRQAIEQWLAFGKQMHAQGHQHGYFSGDGWAAVKLRELATALKSLAQGREAGMSPAAIDVIAERKRQVEKEKWSIGHDDEHDRGELAMAASCYARSSCRYAGKTKPPPEWCWDSKWWKPTTPRRDLIKAGALILAEIERLDRATLRGEGEKRDADLPLDTRRIP